MSYRTQAITRTAGIRRQKGTQVWALVSIVVLLLSGCASVPVVDETLSGTNSPAEIQMTGRRGPLSRKQSRALLAHLASTAPEADALQRHLAVEQAVAESPLFTGNQVRILRDGAQTFPAMFAAIRGARRYLYLEYYIFEDVSSDGEQLSDLLLAKARAGVQISLIYDAVGSLTTPRELFSRLQQAGIRVLEFNPLNPLRSGWHLNERDHRKMLIADGSLAIVGGVNLSSTYQSAPSSASGAQSRERAGGNQEIWHDTDLQIAGPVVIDLEKLFIAHWREQQGPELAAPPTPESTDTPEGDQIVRIIGSTPRRLRSRYYVTVLSAIRNAERSIWITAAYFVPTLQEKLDLERAARKGIDVRLLLPSRSDSSPALQVQHSHYAALLRAGVKIYERNDGILHSKTMVVDGVWSITGSSNFDHRSVLFNDEVDAVVLGADTGAQLAELFQSDLKDATPINAETWRNRSTFTKLREQFWKLWERLL